MRSVRTTRLIFSCVICWAAAATATAPEIAPTIALFDQIERGRWQLHEVGSTAAPRDMCIIDPASFIQLQHAGKACTRAILDDQPRAATIHYSCPGAGDGRTIIRLETRNILHLETQGIAGGAPFDMAFEARRMGECIGRH